MVSLLGLLQSLLCIDLLAEKSKERPINIFLPKIPCTLHLGIAMYKTT